MASRRNAGIGTFSRKGDAAAHEQRAALRERQHLDPLAQECRHRHVERLVVVTPPLAQALLAVRGGTRRAATTPARGLWISLDGAAIAPMMGCDSATDYYEQASCGKLLSRARVPMLFVSARNDPVASADAVDPHLFARGPEDAPLLLAVTREGGHSMTWPEGWDGGGRDWSTAVLCEFVAAVEGEKG